MKTYRERAYIAMVEKLESYVSRPYEAGKDLYSYVLGGKDVSLLEFFEGAQKLDDSTEITVPLKALAALMWACEEVVIDLDLDREDDE